jgi:hypothetical protein
MWLDRSRACHSAKCRRKAVPYEYSLWQFPRYERTAVPAHPHCQFIPLFLVTFATSGGHGSKSCLPERTTTAIAEILMKRPEERLPDGRSFPDENGITRYDVRIVGGAPVQRPSAKRPKGGAARVKNCRTTHFHVILVGGASLVIQETFHRSPYRRTIPLDFIAARIVGPKSNLWTAIGMGSSLRRRSNQYGFAFWSSVNAAPQNEAPAQVRWLAPP